MTRFVSAFVLVTFVGFCQTAYADCSSAGTPIDASTDFSVNTTGGSASPLLNAMTPSCEREWVHEGKNTPKNKEIYLQATWMGSLPNLVKPANPTPNDISVAKVFATECKKAHITAEFWVKSVSWRAIPSPVWKQKTWNQSGIWDDATWTCSMPNLHTTVSSVEAVRVAAFASYGFLDGKEKFSKVGVWIQTL